jgi:L-fucose isomerase-like protein
MAAVLPRTLVAGVATQVAVAVAMPAAVAGATPVAADAATRAMTQERMPVVAGAVVAEMADPGPSMTMTRLRLEEAAGVVAVRGRMAPPLSTD